MNDFGPKVRLCLFIHFCFKELRYFLFFSTLGGCGKFNTFLKRYLTHVSRSFFSIELDFLCGCHNQILMGNNFLPLLTFHTPRKLGLYELVLQVIILILFLSVFKNVEKVLLLDVLSRLQGTSG